MTGEIQTPQGPMSLVTECRTCGEPARFPLAFCRPCRDAILRGESVALTAVVAGGREGVSPRRGPGRDDHGATTAGAA